MPSKLLMVGQLGMPDPDNISRFEASRLKVERARIHIENLRELGADFFETVPYSINREHDRETGVYTFRVIVNSEVPSTFGVIIGDAIHNLRSALDLMAVDLARANGHTSRSALNDTYFPISKDRTQFESSGKKKIKKLSFAAQRAIEELEPYRGGKTEALYQLHHLDIADKHASLVPVGAAYVSPQPSFRMDHDGSPLTGYFEIGGCVQLADPPYPLKDGSVIAIISDVLDARFEPNVEASFDLVFSELGIVDGVPVMPLLCHFYMVVAYIVTNFEVYMSEGATE